MNKKENQLQSALALRTIEQLHVDQWADKYRFLAPTVASKPGKWRTSNVEVARGVLRSVTEKGAEIITCAVATQLLKTSFIENTMAWVIHQQPCPALLVFPKTDLARSFSKERLAGMISATPVLRDIFGDGRQDKSESSQFYKEFPGGFIALASAGSISDLAMRPVRIVLEDEIDKYEATKEGSAILLAEERTATFRPNALHIRCSSPTISETSLVDQSYKESDQRRAFLQCPNCEHHFVPDFFRDVNWTKTESGEHITSTAQFSCPECMGVIDEPTRFRLLTTPGHIRWQQTRKFVCCGVEQNPQTTRAWRWDEERLCGFAQCTECGADALSNRHIGFSVGKLMSPWPEAKITALASKWIEAKGDSLSKQVFYNTVLGQAFEAHDGKKLEANTLAERLEQFPPEMPKQIVRVTAGCDVQVDRIEVHVIGYSEFYEAWSLYYHVIEGSPGNLSTWDDLEEFLTNFQLPSQWGAPMPIHACCIDTGGHFTQQVYNFCIPRKDRNVFAVKGSSHSRRGDPIWPLPEQMKTKSQGRVARSIKAPTFRPYIVNVDVAKDVLREMLLKEEVGPGYLHLPIGRSTAWLDQLTSEYPIYERKGGQTIRKWHCPRNARNEVSDTAVYSICALEGLRALRRLDLHKLTNVLLPAQMNTLPPTTMGVVANV
jgi:phage terminase large subunit GpA-like protein